MSQATFERIQLSVPSIEVAVAEYRQLLGHDPVDEGDLKLFPLGNITLALREDAGAETAVIESLYIAATNEQAVPAGSDCEPFANALGVDLRRSPARLHGALRDAYSDFYPRVDHLVLRTGDPDACIAVFGEQLGMRLALDQVVPEFGGRMLFFRSGKMTLEVIAPLDEPPEQNHFWGITYKVEDLDASWQRLTDAGVAISEIRAGRKAGTRVATVRSHCLGLPTLLLEAREAA